MEKMRALRAGISPVDSAETLKGKGVEYFQGKGKFVCKSIPSVLHHLDVACRPHSISFILAKNEISVNGKILKFAKACIATGARPGERQI